MAVCVKIFLVEKSVGLFWDDEYTGQRHFVLIEKIKKDGNRWEIYMKH